MAKNLGKIKSYLKNKKKFKENFYKELTILMEEARLIAIESAIMATPPNDKEKVRGKNTITGSLARAWEKDSDEKVTVTKDKISFMIRNHIHYATYVDKGHSMDQHYVPGLYINPLNGLLEYDKNKADELGIVVGTKTSWVEGCHMMEKSKEAFDKYIRENIEKRVKKAWEET